MLQRSGMEKLLLLLQLADIIVLMFLSYRDLVLSHLIMLENDEFLKEHCDNVTFAPAPNYISSNQNSGMLAAWRII